MDVRQPTPAVAAEQVKSLVTGATKAAEAAASAGAAPAEGAAVEGAAEQGEAAPAAAESFMDRLAREFRTPEVQKRVKEMNRPMLPISDEDLAAQEAAFTKFADLARKANENIKKFGN